MGVKEPNLYGSAEDRLDTMVGSVSKERMMIWACIRRARAEYEKTSKTIVFPPKSLLNGCQKLGALKLLWHKTVITYHTKLIL